MSYHAIITGSTDGIGKLAAQELARLGHRIFLHGRSAEKLEKTRKEILSELPEARVDTLTGDLSDFSSIADLTREGFDRLDRIDILINNAGIYHSAQSTTPEGLDMRFMVNYIAPMMTTHAWLPLLRKSDHRRVVNLSSAAQSPVDLAALRGEVSLTESTAYAQSKLALTSWSFQLDEEHEELTVVALNPGSLLNTKMVSEAFGKYWSPAEKGSQKICELALASKIENEPNAYYDNDQERYTRAHKDAYDQEKQSELREVSLQIIEKYKV